MNLSKVVLTISFVIALSTPVFGDDLQKDIPESAALVVAQSKEIRLHKGDLNAAEKILLEVIAKHPNYYKAHYNLGLVYQDKGNYDAAIKELEKAREIREKENLPEYSIYNTLGWVYMHQGSNKQAEASYKAGLKYESQNSFDSNRRLYSNLSWFYYLLGDPDEAKKYVDVAERKYQSESVAELRRLIDQLAVDKQKIEQKSDLSVTTQQSLPSPKK